MLTNKFRKKKKIHERNKRFRIKKKKVKAVSRLLEAHLHRYWFYRSVFFGDLPPARFKGLSLSRFIEYATGELLLLLLLLENIFSFSTSAALVWPIIYWRKYLKNFKFFAIYNNKYEREVWGAHLLCFVSILFMRASHVEQSAARWNLDVKYSIIYDIEVVVEDVLSILSKVLLNLITFSGIQLNIYTNDGLRLVHQRPNFQRLRFLFFRFTCDVQPQKEEHVGHINKMMEYAC